MKKLFLVIVICFVLLTAGSLASRAEMQLKSVSAKEASRWTHLVVPLPKEMEILSKAVLSPGDVSVEIPNSAEALVEQASRELGAVLSSSSGTFSNSEAFTITFQQGGPQSEPLKTLPNAEQAYRIMPRGTNDGLILVALTSKGLYYASKTLKQLIKASDQKVEIPLVTVTDWPDLDDRGIWGVDAFNNIPWLSDRKMNYMEQISSTRMEPDGTPVTGFTSVKQRMVDEGPTYGINPVPAILHMEQTSKKGLFDAYPELKCVDCAEGAVCYSKPKIIDVLEDWITGYATMENVDEVDVWLAENLHGQPGCQCPQCKDQNRDLLEINAIVSAWKKVKEKLPAARLRVSTTEETEDSNEEILEELPQEIKVWYYHSLWTYTAGDDAVVRPYLERFTGEGRWIGVVPSLVPHVGLTQPFTGAHFVHSRTTEFLKKGISGVLGYPTPRIHYNRFNVEALAEWAWNATGRSPKDFAYSWAVREGLPNPELFSEWSETLGPVAWDVYGSHWPAGEKRNALEKVASKLEDGTLPELGFVLWDVYRTPWGDIRSVEQLDLDAVHADAAIKLARQMGIEEFIQESLVVEGYIQSLKALWELKHLVGPDGVAEGKERFADQYFSMYLEGLQQAKQALPKWEDSVRIEPKRYWVDETIEIIDRMFAQMQAVRKRKL